MNQLEALRETVRIAERKGMPEFRGSDLGLAHLRDMLTSVDKSSFSPSKLGRWLGWAQCAVVASDVGVTLADMKAVNIKWAGDSPVSSAARPGLSVNIDRLRQLCATPFDVLEIEDDDGTVTDTPVVRAADVIAALDDLSQPQSGIGRENANVR